MTVRIAIKEFAGNRFFLPGELGKICVTNELAYAFIDIIKDEDNKTRYVYDIYDLDPEQAIILKFHFPELKFLKKE